VRRGHFVGVSLLTAHAACGGSDHAPALQDYSDDGESRGATSNSTGGSSASTVGAGGAQGASASAGTGAASGTYIPTPVEGAAGTSSLGGSASTSPGGGQGGSGTTTVEPCSLGIWDDDFTAYSQTDVQQLSGYTRVTGQFYVGTSSSTSATDVTSLSALGCLQVVEGDFTILESPLLTNLQGLERLEEVAKFTISTNAGLETLEGPTALVVLGVLHIRANGALRSLSQGILDAADLYINENPLLPQCRAEAFAASMGLSCQCEGNAASPCD
jgi:hypothetical protein